MISTKTHIWLFKEFPVILKPKIPSLATFLVEFGPVYFFTSFSLSFAIMLLLYLSVQSALLMWFVSNQSFVGFYVLYVGHPTCMATLNLLDLITSVIMVEEYKLSFLLGSKIVLRVLMVNSAILNKYLWPLLWGCSNWCMKLTIHFHIVMR
jgi:hypothetical protein